MSVELFLTIYALISINLILIDKNIRKGENVWVACFTYAAITILVVPTLLFSKRARDESVVSNYKEVLVKVNSFLLIGYMFYIL